MVKRRRYSFQQKQERISRRQFQEFLEPHEWITDDIDPDLGEDIFVRIYDKGISTGLSLYVQLKSVLYIDDHQLGSGEISYSFKVKDIDHWDAQIPTVFLVIWEITREIGWWIWICDVIGYLNKNIPDWHKQKNVNIHIPIENILDENGLNRIRDIVVTQFFPIIAKDKDIDIHAKFIFPPTPEGKAKLAELQRHVATGDEVELDGRYIAEFDLPDWFKRLHGIIDPKSMVLRLGPAEPRGMRPAQIDFISPEIGEVRIPYVELRNIKQGQEEITISNEQQTLTFKIRFILNVLTEQHQITIRIKFGNMDTITAIQAVRIQQILAYGGKIRITDLDTNESSIIPCAGGISQPPEDDFVKFIENLVKIQGITEKQIHFPEDGNFTQVDLSLAEDIALMLETGRLHKTGERFSVNLMKPAIAELIEIHRRGEPLRFRLSSKESNAEILRQLIHLGPTTQLATGRWDMPVEEVTSWFEKAKDEDCLQVILSSAEIYIEFQKWMK
jgi:hypothetical protein